MNLNKWAKGKQLTNRLVFAGGDPLFRWLPKVVKWGTNVSLFWLGTELVWLGKEASMTDRELLEMAAKAGGQAMSPHRHTTAAYGRTRLDRF